MITHPRSWLPKRVVEFYDAQRFEAVTAWGQLRQKPYRGTDFDYLQVACGENLLAGFLNTDHFINRGAAFHCDIRYPLPFENERWTGIYAHHIVEHIRYSKALSFMREARRTLRPGGTLRIVVPDVEPLLRIYAMPISENERVQRIYDILPEGHRDQIDPMTPLGMVNWVFYCGDLGHSQHYCGWDFGTLALALQQSGFSRVERVEFGMSRDPKLTGVDTPLHWAPHSLYVEAVK